MINDRQSVFVAANTLLAWACVSWLGYLALSRRVFPVSPDSSLSENPFPYYSAVLLALSWGVMVALLAWPQRTRMSHARRMTMFGPLALAAMATGIWYFRA
jgi:hypothetical protein